MSYVIFCNANTRICCWRIYSSTVSRFSSSYHLSQGVIKEYAAYLDFISIYGFKVGLRKRQKRLVARTKIDFFHMQMMCFAPSLTLLFYHRIIRPLKAWKLHFCLTKNVPASKNHDFVSIMLTKVFVKVLDVYGAHKKWMAEIWHAFGPILMNFIPNKISHVSLLY